MFHAKSDKKQKIFFYTPVSKFQNILTLNICDEAKQIYPKKKNILRKDTLRISVAAVRRCIYSKKGVLKTGGISQKFMIFIMFKTCDKTCSKIEKAWFLLLQWVAKSSKMNGKMFILIYLSNN